MTSAGAAPTVDTRNPASAGPTMNDRLNSASA